MRFIIVTTSLGIVLAASAVAFSRSETPQQTVAYIAPMLLPLSNNSRSLVEPVKDFTAHVTKKHFGIYITPDTSPIQGDRFTGYHTGVDAEFTDGTDEVSVHAIADGTIISRTWSKGYGGVAVIKHVIDGIPTFALYGHLDTASFAPGITQVKAGEIIGVLGDDHSRETDGVRKHLHFALYRGEKIDYRGYVPTQADLAPWLDPLDFF